MKKKNKRLLKELNQKILMSDRRNDRLVASITDLSHRVSQCEYDIVTIRDCIRELREDSTNDTDLQDSFNTLVLALQGCRTRLAEIWSDK